MKKLLLLAAFIICTAGAKLNSSFASSAAGYKLSQISISIAENTSIDWNTPGTEQHQYDRFFIEQIFKKGTQNGVSSALLGARNASVDVEIVKFDILSDVEKFFCCAQNEVSAWYTLRDLQTGEVIIPRTYINFGHIGRGGILAWISVADRTDQTSRLVDLISKKSARWASDPG